MNAYKFKNNTGTINVEEIIDILEQYQVVTFDVFDTLLKRNVRVPSDVFMVMEEVSLKESESYIEVFEKRKSAEKKARKQSQKEDITLDEIYELYEEKDADKKSYLKQLELDIERSILVENKDILPVYQYCCNSKKEIYLISDMYLPHSFVEEILGEKGFTGYKRLYMSSEYGYTKRTGELYKLFLNESGILPKQVCHIGDDWYSDVKIPAKLGISTIHIWRTVIRSNQIPSKCNSIGENYFYHFINNNIDLSQDRYYQFGYKTFGPVLWGFVNWLFGKVKAEGIDKLYFFSRDALIMKQAFDFCFENSGIETYYFEASRRSLRVPVLWMDPSLESLINIISISRLISIKSIFDGVGLDIKEYGAQILRHGLHNDSVFDRNSILQNSNLKSLFDDILIDIIENSKKEYRILIDYIDQMGMHGKFGVVDIGWSGGMQRLLDQIMSSNSIDHDISGFYIGVSDYYKRNDDAIDNFKINGYWFDCANNSNDYDKRSCFVGLFETLCLEQAGSVKNYYYGDNGEVKARRYAYEYSEDGKLVYEYYCIKSLQKGARQFIRDASEDNLLSLWELNADCLCSSLHNAGANPNEECIVLFSQFPFYDDGITSQLAAPQSLCYYIFHIRDLKRDFLESRWKSGFMRQLLKWKLPYENIYHMLQRIK